MSSRGTVLLGLVAGCGRESVDTAQVCVAADVVDEETGGAGGPAEVLAGETLLLEAYASFGCHSTDHSVECSVTEEAPGELVVRTLTTWTRDEPLAMGCEHMLFGVRGSCETPPLPEGAYVLRFGAGAIAFDVPGTAAGCLWGNGS